MRKLFFLAALQMLFCSFAAADKDKVPGQVTLPLNEYAQLIEAQRHPPREAPSTYAIGKASAAAEIVESEGGARAEISASIDVRVMENEWALVPLLPAGAALKSATMNGSPLQLIATPRGLAWGVRDSGTYNIDLVYSADVQGDLHQGALALPLPLAPSVNFTARLKGTGLEIALSPSTGMRTAREGDVTRVEAVIPESQAAVLTWSDSRAGGIAISRALVKGRVGKDAIAFTAELEVQSFSDKEARVQLLPTSSTLTEVSVDGKSAPILTGNSFYATQVKGRGVHKIEIAFQVAVEKHAGPSGALLPLVQSPITRLELVVPGKKDVVVQPSSNTEADRSETSTTARAFIPMSTQAKLSWTEAVPGAEKEEARLIATIYHTAYAAERTLFVHAIADYEINRGSVTALHFVVPDGIDISKVSADGVKITDWRINRPPGKPGTLDVFFDREVQGALRLNVEYDRPFPEGEGAQIDVPILKAHGIHRERGMLALLAGKELSLKPSGEEGLTRVGENQLPAFLRDQITMTVAHTYKYLNGEAKLSVQAAPPERREGRFDATIDTLISLTDVTLRGSAGIEVSVKSGSIEELELVLPESVNVLNLTAPSLRAYKVNKAEGSQIVNVQFTQDMDGQFKLELLYEFILDDKQPQLHVPTAALRGAEVEQGRIALEALSAVEVEAATATALSSLDPSELPQQLVLKTTNPILLAYKYARVDPPYELELKITRHREIEVQSAVIENANYQTLYTKDGVMVTSARFFVKNSRKQFLRVRLPLGSKIWAAEVNNRPEKPALADARESAPEVLIKIINSAEGFPVTLVYETKVDALAHVGILEGALPQPDMVVTSSHWDVFLPDEVVYGRVHTNMKKASNPWAMPVDAIGDTMERMKRAVAAAPQAASLLSSIPQAGMLLALEKLYASEGGEQPYFSVMYVEGASRYAEMLLIAAAALLLPLGALMALRGSRRRGGYAAASGAALLVLFCGWYGLPVGPAVAALFVAGIAGAGRMFWTRRQRRIAQRVVEAAL